MGRLQDRWPPRPRLSGSLTSVKRRDWNRLWERFAFLMHYDESIYIYIFNQVARFDLRYI